MSATKWTERYNFLRFWVSIIWGCFAGSIILFILFVFIGAPLLQELLKP